MDLLARHEARVVADLLAHHIDGDRARAGMAWPHPAAAARASGSARAGWRLEDLRVDQVGVEKDNNSAAAVERQTLRM